MKSFHGVLWKLTVSLAAFCVLAMVSCRSEKDLPGTASDLEKLGLRGKVKSLTETTFKGVQPTVDNSQRDPEIRESVFFNEKGRITGKSYHFYSSGFTSGTTFEYDRNGNLVEEKILNDKGGELQRTTCWYDEKGRITERIMTDFKMLSQNIEVFSYDENGREVERKNREYRAGGKIVTYIPGAGGQNPDVQRDEGKDIWISVISVYDDNGNKTEEKYFSSDGRLRSRETFRYDEKGRIIETASYNSDDVLRWVSAFKYDSSGNLLEKWGGDSLSGLRLERSCSYDDMGNIIRDVYYYQKWQSGTDMNYTYDAYGNWITKTLNFFSETPEHIYTVSVKERAIEYY